MGTSVPRQFAEEINEFLSQYGFTKVQLIEAGYKTLFDEASEHDLGLAKIMDGYDDFFESDTLHQITANSVMAIVKNDLRYTIQFFRHFKHSRKISLFAPT